MKFQRLTKFLPDKNQLWNFIFFIVGALVVAFYIDAKTTDLNREWTEQKESSQQKSQFVESLSVLSFSRVYYAEAYYLNKTTGENREVVDKAFQLYIDSVADWNKQNVRNSIFIEKYYGEEMKNIYNNDLLKKLTTLHEAVLSVRNGQSPKDFNDKLESAKNRVYTFNEDLYLSSKHQEEI